MQNQHITIIGAGPVGLAMASRLANQGYSFTIIEKGESVGVNILEWGHVSLFSTWQKSVDSISLSLLKKHYPDYSIPDYCPTGKELVEEYLIPLSNIPAIKDNLLLSTTANKINYDATQQVFDIEFSKNEQIQKTQTDIVVDASGTWGNFNSLVHKQSTFDEYIYYGIPPSSFQYQLDSHSKVAVVGNGHSAMNSLLALPYDSDVAIYWLIRGSDPKFGKSKVGGQSNELEAKVQQLIEKGNISLITEFEVKEMFIQDKQIKLVSKSNQTSTGFKYLILNTGASPNYSFVNGISLRLDDKFQAPLALSKRIDPKLHSCDSVSYTFADTIISDAPYYVIGMKSFGKASNFLLSSGYQILDDLIVHIQNSQVMT